MQISRKYEKFHQGRINPCPVKLKGSSHTDQLLNIELTSEFISGIFWLGKNRFGIFPIISLMFLNLFDLLHVESYNDYCQWCYVGGDVLKTSDVVGDRVAKKLSRGDLLLKIRLVFDISREICLVTATAGV